MCNILSILFFNFLQWLSQTSCDSTIIWEFNEKSRIWLPGKIRPDFGSVDQGQFGVTISSS